MNEFSFTILITIIRARMGSFIDKTTRVQIVLYFVFLLIEFLVLLHLFYDVYDNILSILSTPSFSFLIGTCAIIDIFIVIGLQPVLDDFVKFDFRNTKDVNEMCWVIVLIQCAIFLIHIYTVIYKNVYEVEYIDTNLNHLALFTQGLYIGLLVLTKLIIIMDHLIFSEMNLFY